MHWSMMAVRGGIGVLLGLAVLLAPGVGLGELVVLFGIYALLDGICAVAWAIHASRRPLDGWPVLLEGVFSIGLGALALGHPFQSMRFVHVVALWGLVTGVLEILAAGRLARATAVRWCLAAGGAWSIFLAVFLLGLRHALTEPLLIAIGVYALVFGVLVAVAAFRLQRVAVPILMGAVDRTWTTR